MKNILLFLIAVIVIGGAGLYLYSQATGVPLMTTGNLMDVGSDKKMAPPTEPSASGDAAQTLTAADLATHNTSTDCYVAYKGTVYNITSFIPQHPGGPQIMQQCGRIVDDFAQIHPGGSFEKPEIQAVLQQRVVGKLE